MEARRATQFAWSLWVFCVGLVALAVLLDVLNTSTEPPILGVMAALGFLSFPTVGALIASRRPDNSIGWIFSAVGVFVSVMLFGESFAIYALVTEPGSLPGGVAMATALQWGLYAPPVALTGIFLPLLFPDGRLPSRRWRVVPWLAIGFVALAMIYNGLLPGPIELGSARVVDNPTGIEGIKTLLDLIGAGAGLLGLLALLGAVGSLIIRFRKARGDQRQQLKWFTYAAVLVAVSTFLGDFFPSAQGLLAVTFPLIPVAAGIAILRYRLYDIDLIINRTLVYGALTAVLALVYFGGVVGVGGLVRGMTGQERNTLVVAASTLAVAGLFRPARTRIQAFIDRRFYRSRYDAQQTIADSRPRCANRSISIA